MPIRIVVLRGEDVLFSRLYKQQVQAGQDATQWVFSDPNVVVPEPTAADIQVFRRVRRGAAAQSAGPGAEASAGQASSDQAASAASVGTNSDQRRITVSAPASVSASAWPG